MKRAVLILLVCFFSVAAVQAQPMLPVQPQPQEQASPPPVGKMYAVRASGSVPQKPYLDEKLKPIAKVLESLPFTSYEAISINDNVLPWGQETLFPINAVYALHATPLGQEEDGSIALRARVEMLRGESYINALDTVAQAVRNQALFFRGLPLGQDELVIVLLVGAPQEAGDDSSSQQEAEQEPESDEESQSEQERNDQEEQQEQEAEEENTAEQQEPEPLEPVEGETEKPEGIENLEALLDSLEDIDRREQVEERNRRDRIDFKGEWW